jgi:hypothetical protein
MRVGELAPVGHPASTLVGAARRAEHTGAASAARGLAAGELRPAMPRLASPPADQWVPLDPWARLSISVFWFGV